MEGRRGPRGARVRLFYVHPGGLELCLVQTIGDNPAFGWQERQGRGHRVTVMLAPRTPGAGWIELVVQHAIPREVDPTGMTDGGVAADVRTKSWQIAVDETHGILLERGDWIRDADGLWWSVDAVGLSDGAFGREQRPTGILHRGSALPWLT